MRHAPAAPAGTTPNAASRARNVELARTFLARRRIALVGVSRKPDTFSRLVFRELLRRGYDVVPVNPAAAEVEGRRCAARVQDVVPPVDGALVMTPASRSAAVVRDCLEAGITAVWLHRGAGAGAASPEALDLCRRNGLMTVVDLCPFMVLPDAEWMHRAHALFRTRGASIRSRRAHPGAGVEGG